MEAPSPKKRSSSHLTRLHCPDSACEGKRIYRRRCECGKACVWHCPQCEAVVSASNAARHRCRTLMPVPQPPAAAQRRLLWVMRGLEHHNRVPLPSGFTVPSSLRDQVISEQDSSGDTIRSMEEYNVMASFLHMRHQVGIVRLGELKKWLRDAHMFLELVSRVDFIVYGNWPFDLDHGDLQRYMDLTALAFARFNTRCLPTIQDTVFASHKHLYHSALQTRGSITLPTAYIDPQNAQESTVRAVKELTSAVTGLSALSMASVARSNRGRQSHRVVLKRDVSEVCSHVTVISGSESQLVEAICSVIGTHCSWWWSLQPYVDDFTQNPELKLFFDGSGLMVAAFAQRLRQPLPTGCCRNNLPLDLDIWELRQDPVGLPEWSKLRVNEAIRVAQQARDIVLKIAPSLAPLLRIDLVYNANKGVFIVNEVEYLGNAWLMAQHSGLGVRLVAHFADSVDRYLQLQA